MVTSLKNGLLKSLILLLAYMNPCQLNAKEMSRIISSHQMTEWVNWEATVSTPSDNLMNIYQLMRESKYIEAEKQLASYAKEEPSVIPLWIALLTELQDFKKISQLALSGVIDKEENSVKLASLYPGGVQPDVWFRKKSGIVSLEKNWLVDIPRIIINMEGHEFYFLIDTGASMNVITKRVANDLDLQLDPSLTVSFDTSVERPEQGILTRLPDMGIGPAVARNQTAIVVDNTMLEQKVLGINWYQVDGILGWPIIKNLLIKLDFYDGSIVIDKPVKNDNRKKNFVWLFDDPLVFTEENAPFEFVMFLDTGAQSSQVTSTYLRKVDVGELKWKDEKFDAIGGKGILEKTAKLDRLNFSLPSQKIEVEGINVRVGHRDCIYTNCDGRIGIDSAKNKVMTIDFYNGFFDISNEAN